MAFTPKNLAFHLRYLDDDVLGLAYQQVPHYRVQVKTALDRVIEVIHGLAALHTSTNREELDVYIGRCGESRLGSRMREHRSRFEHGTVLFSTDTEDIVRFETIGIAIVQELKSEGILCVNNCNVKRDGSGQRSRDDYSAVYLVWKRTRRAHEFRRPTVHAIRRVAERVIARLDGLASRRQVFDALRRTKQLDRAADLYWAPAR